MKVAKGVEMLCYHGGFYSGGAGERIAELAAGA